MRHVRIIALLSGALYVPNNGSSLVVYLDTLLVNILSVRFHISLLKVGGKAVHVLVVGENGQGFGTEKAGPRIKPHG